MFICRTGRAQHLLEPGPVARLVAWLDADGDPPPRDIRALNPFRDARLGRAQALVRRAAIARAPGGDAAAIAAMLGAATGPGWVYLNAGHENLSASVMQGARAAGLGRAVLIHDLIPLEHPQFAGPGASERFRALIDAAFDADLLLANSADTAARLRRRAPGAAVVTAPLGIDLPRPAGPGDPGGFVCLGTIEPRKNHALLLVVWERLWRRLGPAAPVLHLVGRRGWRNEAVFDTLDTAPFMGRAVIEHGPLDDGRAAALLAAAQALVFPSLAEGYGLPLAEALALGTPVIASDLPALRETGGDVPDWLPPDDADAWYRAVTGYAADPSPAREAQRARLCGWRVPTWADHFRGAEKAMETVLVQATQGG